MSVFQKKVYIVHRCQTNTLFSGKAIFIFQFQSVRTLFIQTCCRCVPEAKDKPILHPSADTPKPTDSLSKGSILMGVCHRPLVYHSLRSRQFNQAIDDDEVCVCLFHFLRMKCDNLTIQFTTWRTSFRGIFRSGMPNAY